jgi:hypothetical protein
VYGASQQDGSWGGWIVFFPLDGSPAVATDAETTQSTLESLGVWAAGLTAVYLEGALVRALQLAAEPPVLAYLDEAEHHLPVQRACRVVRLSRAAFYRPPAPSTRRDAAVTAALTDVVARYPRWGFWKLFDRMRVEGRRWNHKPRASGLPRTAAEFAQADDAAGASACAATAGGSAAAEPDVGARLHDRNAL